MRSIPAGQGPTRGGKAKDKREIAPQEPLPRGSLDYEMDWIVRKFFAHLWHNDHGSELDLQRAVNLIEALNEVLHRRTIPRQ